MADIKLILFHCGSPLPAHAEYCLKQIRIFNPGIKIYFLCDREYPVFKEYGCTYVDIGLFYTPDIDIYVREFSRYRLPVLWTASATRFFYIRNFMKHANITDAYHFENDIMLYYDLERLHSTFTMFPGLAVTPCEPNQSTTGFMWIKNHEALWAMTDFFIHALCTMTDAQIKAKYGMEMVNEMSLMKSYGASIHDKGNMFLNLPILPDTYSTDFCPKQPVELMTLIFGDTLFDPATYGQYVGGTPAGDPPGVKVHQHYIGRMLMKMKDPCITFYPDEKGRKVPYLMDVEEFGSRTWRINNLHIHRKTLKEYMSL